MRYRDDIDFWLQSLAWTAVLNMAIAAVVVRVLVIRFADMFRNFHVWFCPAVLGGLLNVQTDRLTVSLRLCDWAHVENISRKLQ